MANPMQGYWFSPPRQTNNTVASQPQTKAMSLGAGSALGGIAGVIGGLIMNRSNRRFAKQQADTAWQRELEQWHRANEYNSPKAQMARLKAAGLNPNMVYGTGTQASGTAASSAPSAQTAKHQAQFPTIDVAERMARIKNIQADTLATLTGEKYTGQKAEGQRSKNIVLAAQAEWAANGLLKQQLLANIGLTNMRKDESRVRAKLIEAQKQLTDEKTNLAKSGLSSSDNTIIRLLGLYGAKNPVEAANILNGILIQLGQSL